MGYQLQYLLLHWLVKNVGGEKKGKEKKIQLNTSSAIHFIHVQQFPPHLKN